MFTVVPSTCYDNAPMSVIESLGYGKPVIGTRIGGIPEQIDESCGRLVTPGDVDELRQQILELSADSDLLRKMGAAGRDRVMTKYAPEAHYESLMKVFESVLPPSV
jgi:glycosyltransferase involved in cell wall biosynthesis